MIVSSPDGNPESSPVQSESVNQSLKSQFPNSDHNMMFDKSFYKPLN